MEADVNATDIDGGTALHIAAYYNNFDLLKYLIDHGADVNATDIDGRTALHIATKNKKNNLHSLKYLIDHGADVNAADRNGKTAFHYCGSYRLEQYLRFQSRYKLFKKVYKVGLPILGIIGVTLLGLGQLYYKTWDSNQ